MRCPECGSADVLVIPGDDDEAAEILDWVCAGCGAEWNDEDV